MSGLDKVVFRFADVKCPVGQSYALKEKSLLTNRKTAPIVLLLKVLDVDLMLNNL